MEKVPMGEAVPLPLRDPESGLSKKRMDRFIDESTISCAFKANEVKFDAKGEVLLFGLIFNIN